MADWLSDKTIKAFLSSQAGIILPLAQSVVSGLAFGLIVLSLAIIFDQQHPWALAGLAAGITGGISWFISLSWWRSRVYQSKSPKLPNVMGSSEVLRLQVSVNSDLDSAFGASWANLPIPRDKLLKMAKKLMRGGGFSYGSLAGRHKVLTRSEFEAVRDEFISRGLLRWRSAHARNSGVELTPAGRAVIRRLAAMADAPPPRGREFARKAIRPGSVSGVQMHTPPESDPDPDEDIDLLDEVWR